MFGAATDPDDDDFDYGVDLFNAGYWWEAHVYFERLWAEARRTSNEDTAVFLQGLIQLAAALVKSRQGSASGEAALRASSHAKLRLARERLGATFLGVEIDDLADRIERGETPLIHLRR